MVRTALPRRSRNPKTLNFTRAETECNRERKLAAPAPYEFQLLGHSCPYAHYPAPVIPVGMLDGALVVVYAAGSKNAPTIELVTGNRIYVPHHEYLNNALAHFEYRKHRLFAYSETDVTAYEIAREREFFLCFLNTAKSDECYPAIRKMLERAVCI